MLLWNEHVPLDEGVDRLVPVAQKVIEHRTTIIAISTTRPLLPALRLHHSLGINFNFDGIPK